MKKLFSCTVLLVALGCCSMAVQGQQVYRCGKSYSQVPCPGSTVVDTSDVRTPKQRVAAQKATVRDTALAADLEKTRQQEEAMAAAGSAPVVIAPATKTSKTGKAKNKRTNKKEPELFTAHAAPEKKKKKPAASVP